MLLSGYQTHKTGMALFLLLQHLLPIHRLVQHIPKVVQGILVVNLLDQLIAHLVKVMHLLMVSNVKDLPHHMANSVKDLRHLTDNSAKDLAQLTDKLVFSGHLSPMEAQLFVVVVGSSVTTDYVVTTTKSVLLTPHSKPQAEAAVSIGRRLLTPPVLVGISKPLHNLVLADTFKLLPSHVLVDMFRLVPPIPVLEGTFKLVLSTLVVSQMVRSTQHFALPTLKHQPTQLGRFLYA